MKKQVHLIGIGGSGLSGIAKVLLESGIAVSGSDRQMSPLVEQLQQIGAQVSIGHRAENIAGADVVLRSSAIPDDNVEVAAALAAGIPVLKRVDYLPELTADKQIIAIAGTHGKTTCTAMLTLVLSRLGYEPSYIIGGISRDLGANAHAGEGDYFVIEADEYDGMFLGLNPAIAVVTNIEHDHPDCYPTYADFFKAFGSFAKRIKSGGVLVVCGDDRGARQLLDLVDEDSCQKVTYGISELDSNYSAKDLSINLAGGYSFTVVRRTNNSSQELSALRVNLQVPGEHNVSNALAVISVLDMLAIPLEQAVPVLEEYSGTSRRFEVYDQIDGIVLIDDYAHHPTEIRATLQAARQRYPDRSIWAVWQPHTYSRTRTLLDQYSSAFVDADRVLVMDIYAARERQPVNNFSAAQVLEAIEHPHKWYLPNFSAIVQELLANMGDSDVVLVLSAGDADQINLRLADELWKRN